MIFPAHSNKNRVLRLSVFDSGQVGRDSPKDFRILRGETKSPVFFSALSAGDKNFYTKEKFCKKRIILMNMRNKIFFAAENIDAPNLYKD